jgi:hypothetical protein
MTGTRVSARTRTGAGMAGNRSLTAQATVLCALLLVQFFAGMITNLYVTIPDNHPGTGGNFFSSAPRAIAWAISSASPWLALHAALGLALAVASLAFIVNAARSRDRAWIWLSVAGSLLLIGAGFNGGSFLVYNHDFSSLIMSGLFALCFACYLAGIYVAARRGTTGRRR